MFNRRFTAWAVALLLSMSAMFVGAPVYAGTTSPSGQKVHKLHSPHASKTALKGKPPGGFTTLATACSSPCYAYAERHQTFSQPTAATGALATFSVHKPERRAWDYHTLAEMAICDASHDNCVEAGWTVDNALNGDNNPHFFVFWWLNGVGQGYNTSDFQVSGTAPVTPGQDVNSYVGTATLPIKWEHFDNATCGCTSGWWLSNNTSFIGVYPDTLWSGGFTSPGTVQNFGEVTLSQTPSQTDMGNGDIATSAAPTQGAAISNLQITGTGAPAAGYTGSVVTYSDRWDVYSSSSTAFRYGGPGGNVTVPANPAGANDCSGVGKGTDPSGWGEVCFYDGISAGSGVTKIASLDGAAGASCRTGYGSSALGLGTDMVVNASYKKIDLYSTNNCTGTKLTLGLGRTTLPAPYANATNLSFIVTSSYVTCATGYPTTAPTC